MAITLDATSNSGSNNNVTTFSWSHTVGSGATKLIVFVSTHNNPAQTVASVAWDTAGVNEAFTEDATATNTGDGVPPHVALWYLDSPTAKTANITVTLDGQATRGGAGAYSLFGTATGAPEDTTPADTQTNALSTAVTATDGAWVLDGASKSGANNDDQAPGGSETQAWGFDFSVSRHYSSERLEDVSSGSVSLTWSVSSSTTEWAHLVASFAVASGYSLALDAGSFTFSGKATGLAVSRQIALAAGSLTFSGKDPALAVGRQLVLTVGSLTFTGNDVTLKVTRKLVLTAGSLSFSGNDAALVVGRQLALTAGSLSFTGNDVTLTYTPSGATYTLALDAGSLTFTGYAAGLTVGRQIALGAGSLGLTGNAASLAVSRQLALAAGSLSLSGNSAALVVSRQLVFGAGTLTLNGNAVTLVVSRVLALGLGTLTFTGNTVTLQVSRALALGLGALSFTGNDVTLAYTLAIPYDLIGTVRGFKATGTVDGFTPATSVRGFMATGTVTGTLAGLFVALATENDLALATEINEPVYLESSTVHAGDFVRIPQRTGTVVREHS